MKFCSPRLLNTMSWPENLVHPRRSLKCYGSIESRLGTARVQPPHLNIVNEGHVVRRVPVQAVVTLIKRNRVQEVVDGLNNIFTILLGGTVLDGQTSADEVVLNIDNYKGRLWFDYFLDPFLITVIEFLNTHTAIPTCVENVEHVCDSLSVQTDYCQDKIK